jgi:tetratricopeptide (TPR) repeat protein
MRARRAPPRKNHGKDKVPARQQRLRDRNIYVHEPLLLEAPQDLLGISNDQLGEMYQIAHEFLEQEANADAVRAFTILCHIHPYVPDFWYGLGRALRACGQYEEALSMLLTAETMDPSRFEFYQESIDCCVQMGKRNEAVHIFRRLRAHRRSIEGFSSLRAEMKDLEKKISFTSC